MGMLDRGVLGMCIDSTMLHFCLQIRVGVLLLEPLPENDDTFRNIG